MAFSKPKPRFSSLIANKVFASFVIALGVLLVVGVPSRLFPETSPFYRFFSNADLGVRNMLLQSYAQKAVHPAITVVAIDDRTLSNKGGGLGRWQEFKREYYARVIDRLKKDGAVVIAVDVLFSESSSSGDEELAKSIRNAGNVVLGFSRGQNLFPIPEFLSAASVVGFFDPSIHPINSSVYSVHPVGKVAGKLYESFSFATLRKYLDLVYGKKTSASMDRLNYEKYYEFHEGDYRFVPYALGAESNEFLISYLPRQARFPQLSFSDVYRAETTGVEGDYRPELVKDKIVLIGATATALHDEFFTPMGVLEGVFVHANAINTVLNRAYVTNASKGVELAVLGLLTFFFSLFLLHVGNRVYQVLVSGIALVVSAGFYVFVFWLFRKQFNYPVELSLIVVLVALASTAYKYILEEKGKRLLKNALSQYLAEDLVASVLNDYDQMKLGGDRREVTLFFSDIAGFTTISENMEPEELVRFLSVYLKEVSDVIMHEKGFINKYEGDAVMAIWGAFREQPDQAHLACLSALEQQRKITEMNREFRTKFGFEIQVRMGINKGPAIVGNIGSEGKKIEFTALGDTVNTASRFEGINKLYGSLICVGESTMEETKDSFVFRKLDSIMVKGKEKPTAIYELVGAVGEVSPERLAMIAEFERALALYAAGDVKAGKEIFAALWEKFRDPPSEVFMNRCGKLVEEGVPEGWTGVYRATEK